MIMGNDSVHLWLLYCCLNYSHLRIGILVLMDCICPGTLSENGGEYHVKRAMITVLSLCIRVPGLSD